MRLFVAIELPERVRSAVEDLTARARRSLPRARWVRAENLHLTLAFLGDVAEARLAELGRTLTETCAAHPPFELGVEGAGCFPARGRARVAWVGMTSSAALTRLQGALAHALRAALGLVPDGRPFHPHLTVARCAPPWPAGAARSWTDAVRGGVGERFPVRDVALVHSRLGPAGPSYAILQRFPLEATP